MDTTYRFRFLIYFAAFMLVMSVCFVYAEPVPSHSHLLFQVAPQHSGFLASSALEPAFDPAALRTATAPVVSPVLLQELEGTNNHGRRGFLHHTRHAVLRPAQENTQNASSILGLTLDPSSSAASLR